jgi:DNA-binding CsgD family transcriptional regulator
MYVRLIRPSDLRELADLIDPGFQAAPDLRAALPSLWERLLAAGQLHGNVVAAAPDSHSNGVLAAGLTVFVDDAFVNEYLRAPVPYVSGIVYERLADGRSPILSVNDAAAANAASALNLLILHFGTKYPNPSDERGRAVLAAAHSGFQLTHLGYRARRILQEAYGDAQVPFFTAGGFLVKSTPRFGFSRGEQRVLQLAVLDEQDDAIARELGVSLDGVKKTWRRIHQRVSAIAPELAADFPATDASRGKERRRHLLRYLRHHLEELRAYPRAAPRFTASRTRRSR